MVHLTRASAVLAMGGALVLLLTGYGLALEGAKQYRTLLSVQMGVVVGVVPAYFIVLWITSWVGHGARSIAHGKLRKGVIGLIVITAGGATLLAPLLPAIALTVGCRTADLLCPASANPILWSYLKLVTSLPVAPVLVGSAFALGAALAMSRRGG